MEQHFRGGLQGTEKFVNWFASAASKAAERALDSLDPWVVGRCEWLPVCVCVWGGECSRPLLKGTRLPWKFPHPGSRAPFLGLHPRPRRRLPGRPTPRSNQKQLRAGPAGPPLQSPRDATGGGRSLRGRRGRGGGPPGPPCTSGAIGSARLSSPRFCSHSCVHSARDPPSDP